MYEQTRHETIIIGGGASGVLLAWQLARQRGRPATLIEPAAALGQGLAYATPSLEHLLNVPASGMSATPQDADHFLDWLRRRINPQARPGDFVARAIYALYLRELALESGVVHIRSSVRDCRRHAGDWRLTLEDGRQLQAGQVVLALGHQRPRTLPGSGEAGTGLPHYAADAWQPDGYAGLQPQDHIALIGSGLTMVDALLWLRQRGHRGRVTAVSGHALLPQRHGSLQPLAGPLIQPGQGPATARGYLRTFHQSLRTGIDARALVDSLRPVSNALWLALSDREKHRFRRHLQRRWDVLRHRMAPRIADRVQEELASGGLRLQAGRVESLQALDGRLVLSLRHGGHRQTLTADRVINCSGPDPDCRRASSPLLRSMLAAGDMVAGLGGGGLACDAEGRLLDAAGAAVPGLYVIGPARQGQLFESVAIPEIRQQAEALAVGLAHAEPAAAPMAALSA